MDKTFILFLQQMFCFDFNFIVYKFVLPGSIPEVFFEKEENDNTYIAWNNSSQLKLIFCTFVLKIFAVNSLEIDDVIARQMQYVENWILEDTIKNFFKDYLWVYGHMYRSPVYLSIY